MMTSKANKFFKVSMLGLAASFAAVGMAGPASAADLSPLERAKYEEWRNAPRQEIVWTSEELREGAEYAKRLDSENPFPEEAKPYQAIDWTSEELREAAENAQRLNREK